MAKNTQRIAQLEKIHKPKAKERTAQVVIYKAGELAKTKALTSGCVVFIPDNSRDKVTV
jgi:hypothetical protein